MKRNDKLKQMNKGLVGCFASLFIIFAATLNVATTPANRTVIDNRLKTTSSVMINSGEGTQVYPYESKYTNTDDLVTAHKELGERLGAESTVLLKNENNALPLSKESGITLFGMRSYQTQYGGSVGATVREAQAVGFADALNNNGFRVNPTLVDFYSERKMTYKPGGLMSSTTVINEVPLSEYSSFSADTYHNYSDAAILVFGRIYGEMKDYSPDPAGSEFSKSESGSILSLSDNEMDLLDYVLSLKESGTFNKVIVVINSATALELGSLQNNENIDGMFWVGLPGAYGLNGFAKVLKGEISPSGRLTDTFATYAASSPAAQNYGNYVYSNADQISETDAYNGNTYLVEAESIYTGYKYYETRYADSVYGKRNATTSTGSSFSNQGWDYDKEVVYPFGYGLSYSTFTQELLSVDVDWEKMTGSAEIKITNTGDVASKHSVQLYVSLPYLEGQVEKSAIQLIGYAKTGENDKDKSNKVSDMVLLNANESETLTIDFDLMDFASWDSTLSHDEVEGGYILDQGSYYFSIRDDVHDALNNVLSLQGQEVGKENDEASKEATFVILSEKMEITETSNGTIYQNQLEDMDINHYIPNTVTYLSRSDWQGTYPKEIATLTATEEMIYQLKNDTYTIKTGESHDYTFGQEGDKKAVNLIGITDYDDPIFDQLLNQISLETMLDQIANGGGQVDALSEISSPAFYEIDGPTGLIFTLGYKTSQDQRVEGTKYAVPSDDPNASYWLNIFPSGSNIAATFSHQLATLKGELIGNDTIWSGSCFWFGPALNLHRTPFNGRSNEYYSEDPVLSGNVAADEIIGAQNYGAAATPKHLAFNDQETNRTGVSVYMSEQKAREGELLAFKKAVVGGKSRCLMGSYNRVGATYVCAHIGLITGIVRNEWDFKGLLTSDMVSNSNYQTAKESLIAGTDWMLQSSTVNDDGQAWEYMQEKNASGDATFVKATREAFHHILYAMANTNVFNGMTDTSKVVRVYPYWEIILIAGTSVSGLFMGSTLVLAIVFDVRDRKRGKE